MPLIPPPTTSTSPCLSPFAVSDLVRSAGMLDDFLDNFRDVLDLDRLAVLQAQAAIREIRNAVGAGGNQHLGSDLDGLLQSEIGEPFPPGSLHPDSAATAAATETVFPTLFHLGEFGAGNPVQDVARRVKYLVMPAQVTGIVIGDFLSVLPDGFQPAGLHQLGQQLGDVNDFEIDAEFRIFVLEAVIAMRGRNQDFLDAAVDEILDVFLGQMFE